MRQKTQAQIAVQSDNIARDERWGFLWLLQMESVVFVSVCLLVTFVSLAKKGWTDQDADWRLDLDGPKEPCITWGTDPARERSNFGGCPAHWKALWVSAAVYAAKKSITASARLLQPTALLSTDRCKWCNVNSSLWKNPPPGDTAFCQNSVTTC